MIKPVAAPLCIDCDGTLIRTDLLHEAVLLMLKQYPLGIFLLPFWLLKGKAYLKARIAQHVEFNWSALPYRQEILDLTRSARQQGIATILVTASPTKWAEGIANYLGIFDEVLASRDQLNLSGKNKAQALVKRYGEHNFDYAGNANADLPVWKVARNAIVVSHSKGFINKAKAVNSNPIRIILTESAGFLTYIKAIRVHQWLKNLLIFLPVLAAHDLNNFKQALLAFLAFSACASVVYVINDLLDLEADRQHIRKCKRPFAAGKISVAKGVILVPGLLAVSFGLALLLSTKFIGVLGLYFVMTLAYSIRFKQQVILDVMLLASLYTMRIIAGAAATNITPSFWLLAFSMFIFLSLALVKRYSELLITLEQHKGKAPGRGYAVTDLPVLMALGVSASMNAVLVFAFYLNLPEVNGMYAHKHWLWLISPLLLYWLARIWMKTHRGEIDDDPIIFAVKDWQSLVTLALCACLFGIASVPY